MSDKSVLENGFWALLSLFRPVTFFLSYIDVESDEDALVVPAVDKFRAASSY